MGLSVRAQHWVAFFVCVALLAAAYYFQIVGKMEPCPLCIFQRVAVAALGLIFLAAALHSPKSWGLRVYGLLTVLAASLGGAVAGRHVWLMNLPKDEIPACGPGLNYLLDTFPLGQVLETVLRGSGECAANPWTLLGLSMPGWCLVFFVGLGLLGLWRLAGR